MAECGVTRLTSAFWLQFLGYELARHSARGKSTWTWRRPKQQTAELHTLLAYQARTYNYSALAASLERIARQPGFHGVLSQLAELFHAARRNGYTEAPPKLFYTQKNQAWRAHLRCSLRPLSHDTTRLLRRDLCYVSLTTI